MNVIITLKNLKHSASIDERIKTKSEKFQKYLYGNISARWVCYKEEDMHFAEVNICGPKINFHASSTHENLFRTIDMAVDKIYKQVIKSKDLMKNNVHNRKDVHLDIVEPDDVWLEYGSDEEVDSYHDEAVDDGFYKKHNKVA